MNSAYIDLAIGLALAFVLLSLLASGLNELLVRISGVRAKFLWASLKDLLDTPARRSRTPNGVLDIVGFALIGSRDQRPDFTDRPSGQQPVSVLPGGRPPALADLTDQVHERLARIDFASRKPGKPSKTTVSQVPPKRLALAVVEVLDGAYEGNLDNLLAALRVAKSPFVGPLEAVVADATGDREKLRAGLESWFDSEMLRLTAVYRRHTRWAIASIAFVITAFLGFDAMDYSGSLLDDQAKREQLVSSASSGDPEQLRLACAAVSEDQAADTADCFSSVIGQPALADAFGTSLIRFEPTGNNAKVSANVSAWSKQVRNLAHWPGMAVTVVAMMFGAPFWWEVLRRLMGMRTRRPSAADNA